MSARIVPAREGLTEAVERLRAGHLVAFPTETVYGLGANALDPEAVERIFTAKGRPVHNPLIVHVADVAAARGLAADWPAIADALAARYWPGPLTLVVKKAAIVPDIVTAGGETVGLRVPDHPIALELLRRAGVPLAAPSANRSEEVSPTAAQHVADSLGAFVDDLLILDGGACRVGIESSVLDVTLDPPRLLRPGMTSIDAERGAAGPIARSPGQMARHYAPRKPVRLVRGGKAHLVPGDDPAAFAANLYAELRRLDADPDVTEIVLLLPPDAPAWAAIHDRLRRAAGPCP